VLPHQVVVTDDIGEVNHIHWPPFPAVVHPQPLPQPYANQGDDNPDHPDCQTCTLAGSVGHYRCSPRQPCRRPPPTEKIEITPQCTLPVSKTNGHGQDIFSWDEDYNGWFKWDNAAAADAAADALAAQLWQQADWDEADLPLMVPDHAGSPQSVHSSMPGLETGPPSPLPLQEQNLLDPLPPHHACDWQVRLRENAPLLTVDEMVLWNAQAVHVPAGGSWGAAEPTYARQADGVVFCLPASTYGTTCPSLMVQYKFYRPRQNVLFESSARLQHGFTHAQNAKSGRI
jgi:hypothetical protein